MKTTWALLFDFAPGVLLLSVIGIRSITYTRSIKHALAALALKKIKTYFYVINLTL